MTLAYRNARLSPAALACVVLAHAGVVAAVMSTRSIQAPEPAAALMVEVITPEQPAPAPKTPEITPPKPKPVARRERTTPVQPLPMLAAKRPSDEPAREEIKPALPAPLPPIQAPPPPQQSVAAAPPAPPAPTPTPVPPRFDADYLDNPKPVYPPLSRREREQGKVMLRVYVEPSGMPSKVELGASSGFERLDKSALAAVSRWRFTPAKQGAEAVGAWVTVPVVFSLKD